MQSREFIFNPLLFQSNINLELQFIENMRPVIEIQEAVWMFPNANQRGILFVFALQHFDISKLKEIGLFLIELFAADHSKVTVGISTKLKNWMAISDDVRKLNKALDKHHVIGKNNLFFLEDQSSSNHPVYTAITKLDEIKIAYVIDRQDWQELRNILEDKFEKWEKEECSTVFVEMNLRTILHLFEDKLFHLDAIAKKETEEFIREILYTASTFAEAAEAYHDWVQSIFHLSEQTNDKTSQAVFHKIQQYIAAHMNEPLTLTTLIDEFEISSTSLCNLFRIQGGQTFVEYLTQIRIHKAKELLSDNPHMPIKDISEIIGYSDRHYFSKVFKTIAGSEFRRLVNY